ncbi:MAG: glycosyltransferase family 4 protein [Chitinispirillaceae bacterium]|nr:glycosyltransferase family 4 protein [Chitinispirillaceae bacterium]
MNVKTCRHVILYEFVPPSDGGIAQMAWGIVDELHRRGLKTALAGFGDLLADPMYNGAGFDLWPLPRRGWKHFKDFYGAALAARLFFRYGRDVILYSFTWKSGRIFRLCAKKFGWRYVIFASGDEVTRQIGMRKERLMTATLRAADGIIAISAYTAARLSPIGLSTVTVNNPGVDVKKFHVMDKTECRRRFGWEGKKIVLTAARVVARKGQDTMIRALSLLATDFPDLYYVIAGGGDETEMRRLREIAREMGVEDRVVFFGFVSEPDKPALYNASDVYVMASRYEQGEKDVEGFGITFLEAGGCGVPVIGSTSGGIPDAVENGVNGFLVPPGDHGALAGCLRRLYSDRALMARIGIEGRHRTERLFTWEHFTDRMLRMLSERGIAGGL